MILRDLSAFDPRIRGLVGTPAQVARMADLYHVLYRQVPTKDCDDTMNHTATVQLCNTAGRVVGEIGYSEDEAGVLAKLITPAFPGRCHPGGGSACGPAPATGRAARAECRA